LRLGIEVGSGLFDQLKPKSGKIEIKNDDPSEKEILNFIEANHNLKTGNEVLKRTERNSIES
jgi:hypothetical protein